MSSLHHPAPPPSAEHCQELLRSYLSLCNHEGAGEPWPRPAPLERIHLSVLARGEHLACRREGGGVRYALFLGRAGGREYAVLVSRRLALFQLPVAAPRGLFEGSVFDGELLESPGPSGRVRQVFSVFDVVSLGGDTSVGSQSLEHRARLLETIFNHADSPPRSCEEALAAAKTGKLVCGGSRHGLCFKNRSYRPLSLVGELLNEQEDPLAKDMVFVMRNQPARSNVGLLQLPTLWTVNVFAPDAIVGAQEGRLALGVDCSCWKGGPSRAVVSASLSLREGASVLSYQVHRPDKTEPDDLEFLRSAERSLRDNVRPEELLYGICQSVCA